MEGEDRQTEEESASGSASGARSPSLLPPPPAAASSLHAQQEEQQQQRGPRGQVAAASRSETEAITSSSVMMNQQLRLRLQAHSPPPVAAPLHFSNNSSGLGLQQPRAVVAPIAASPALRAVAYPPVRNNPAPPLLGSRVPVAVAADGGSSHQHYHEQQNNNNNRLVDESSAPIAVDHRRLILEPETENDPFLQQDVDDDDDDDDPNNFTTLSGWSEVELSQEPGGGGVPPSPRSLHAAALLNGVMYVLSVCQSVSQSVQCVVVCLFVVVLLDVSVHKRVNFSNSSLSLSTHTLLCNLWKGTFLADSAATSASIPFMPLPLPKSAGPRSGPRPTRHRPPAPAIDTSPWPLVPAFMSTAALMDAPAWPTFGALILVLCRGGKSMPVWPRDDRRRRGTPTRRWCTTTLSILRLVTMGATNRIFSTCSLVVLCVVVVVCVVTDDTWERFTESTVMPHCV